MWEEGVLPIGSGMGGWGFFVFFCFRTARFGTFWHIFEATKNEVAASTFFRDCKGKKVKGKCIYIAHFL